MKNLFKSQTSYEILNLFISNSDSKYYLNEIAKILNKDAANVSREIKSLNKEGIVSSVRKNNKNYYFLNQNCEYLNELSKLIKKQENLSIKKQFDRDWILAEEIPSANPWFMSIPFYCFTNYLYKTTGKNYSCVVGHYQGYYLNFYFDKDDSYQVAQNLVDKFLAEPKFMETTNQKITKFAQKLKTVTKKIPESNLDKLSKKQIWDLYHNHYQVHSEMYQWAWIPAAVDMFHNNLTNAGKDILKKHNVANDKVENYLSILTHPEKDSLLKQENDNLIKIGIKVQKNKKQYHLFKELFRKFKEEDVKNLGLYTHSQAYEEKFEELVQSLVDKIEPSILNDLQDHYINYFYTKFIYTEEQGVYSFEHYLKSLVRLVAGDNNLQASYQKQEKEQEENRKQKQEIIKDLKLAKPIVTFFNAWGDFMVTKITRRNAQLFALYKTTFLLSEIAGRLKISLKELRFMTTQEIKQALFDNIIDREEIKSRTKNSLYYTEKGVELYYNPQKTSEILKKYFQTEDNQKVDKLQGQCGCRGSVKGTAKIVNVVADMDKVKEGDILVSISTQPDLLPAMKKASAFVTDQGGVTSHAAIVARETNTPCVIGTKNATKVIKDGDEVEVYADKGVVKIT